METKKDKRSIENALKQTDIARKNLLLMLALTVVNIVFIFFDSETMMLFTASAPYYAVVFGYYSETTAYLIAGLAVAAVILILYLLCFIFSKKNYLWMVVALVLFSLDSVILVALYVWAEDVSGILDALIHVYILYYLIIGVKYGHELKNVSPEELNFAEENEAAEEEYPAVDSRPIRRADTDVKFRVLIEGDYEGYHIAYRRVKRTNELVINGYVYDEVEMLVETPHELTANIGGKIIAVGINNSSFSYIAINGEQVAKKLRLI